MLPKPVISIRNHRKSGIAPASQTAPAQETARQRPTGLATRPAAPQRVMFLLPVFANRARARQPGHRQLIIMCSPTRVVMSIGKTRVAGKRMMARAGTMCPLPEGLPRPGRQRPIAPQGHRQVLQQNSRLLRHANPVPTSSHLQAMAIHPAWIAKIIPGSVHRPAAASTVRKDPAVEVGPEGDSHNMRGNAVLRRGGFLFRNPAVDRHLADIQHFGRLVVEKFLFTFSPVFQQVGKSIAVGIHRVGKQPIIFGDV